MSLAQIAGGKHLPEVETLQLKIGGISCSFCASSIEKAVGRQKGVDEVHVSIAHEEALVRFRPGKTSVTKIKDKDRVPFSARLPWHQVAQIGVHDHRERRCPDRAGPMLPCSFTTRVLPDR